MRRISTIRWSVLSFSLAAAGAGCLDLSGGCANSVVREVASPSGDRRAILFHRDCGATTGFSTQVSVLAAGSTLPDSGGNVFGADTDHGKAAAGPSGGPRVDVRWVAPDTLEVRYDGRARVFTREPRYAGTEVRFVADSARSP